MRAWEQVNTLLTDMAPFLKRSGMAESQYRMPTGIITDIKTGKYADVFDFLCDMLDSDEWERVQIAWSLCTPTRWQWYDDYEIAELQEQGILNTACNRFAKLWKENRPTGFFGKHLNEPDYKD